MAKVLGFLAVIAGIGVGLVSQGEAQSVREVKPEPAWCGGSWQPTSVSEVTKDGKTTRTAIPGTGGTNFTPCAPIRRPAKGVDGKDTTIVIPTFPGNPATSVTFVRDAKTGELRGGRMVTTKDKDGKDVRQWMAIEPTVVKQ